MPGVVDLLARRRELQQPELRDDLDNVFTCYYATRTPTGSRYFDE